MLNAQRFSNQIAFTFDSSSKEISEDYTIIMMPTGLYILSQPQKGSIIVKKKHTLCTLMEGNMFWNMVAMSLTCMPSDPKLLRINRGWCVNCWSCILCFFRDETTSLTREYWKEFYKKKKRVLKNVGKHLSVKHYIGSLGASVRLLWKHHLQSHTKLSSFEPIFLLYFYFKDEFI